MIYVCAKSKHLRRAFCFLYSHHTESSKLNYFVIFALSRLELVYLGCLYVISSIFVQPCITPHFVFSHMPGMSLHTVKVQIQWNLS